MFCAKILLLSITISVVLNAAETVKNKHALNVIVSDVQGISCSVQIFYGLSESR